MNNEEKIILQVEDEAIIYMAQAATLKNEGYHVLIAMKLRKWSTN